MKTPSSGGVRFAPSPTGRFHVGNLRTAWISFQFAKKQNLPWVVRFEDIDKPRVLANAREHQLRDMLELSLKPDLEFLQSDFRERHWDLFIKAIKEKQVYACDCSRKEVQMALSAMASAPHSGLPTYTGKCRIETGKLLEAPQTLAWRFKMEDESGKDDFIIARTSNERTQDGLPMEATFTPAYHWACAIDDHDGSYDLLVRSSDLKDSAAPQRAIQKWLGRKNQIPIFHTSLITKNDGSRLEKRTAGVTLEELQHRGISPRDLEKIFANSFDARLLTSESQGEAKEALSLSELGI